ncbi:MAG: hypothetical protein II856_05380 [Bacteroidales bacterium]|nr:hypothetical protein [Bacteroidales bacterium]
MKKFFFILAFLAAIFTVLAQDKPAWTVKLPKATNNTYMYVCEYAIASSESEARNQAIARVFQNAALRIGQPIESDKIFDAVQKGGDLAVISRQYNIPIYKVCEYVEKVQVYSYRVYVLCQVAVSGNITPEFDYNFRGCNDSHQYSNGLSLLKSVFVPGLGQMGKRRYGEGVLTLTGELVLVGGAVTTYYLGKQQLDILKQGELTYDSFIATQKKYNGYRTANIAFWSAAAALYAFNLYRAAAARPKYKDNLSFSPALVPAGNCVAPSINLTFKF